jgi:outer membrane lipoprotein-sorting protein
LRGAVLLLGLLAGLAPAHAQTVSPPAWGLPQLMQALAQTRSASGHFTERQTAPVLSAPLISSGTLIYRAPDYLRKTTTAPAPDVFILEHGKVMINGATSGGAHVFTLDQDPRIAGLITGIRATLAGDLPALQQYYTVTLSGQAAAWQLQLTPKDQSLARFIRAMTIDGAQNHVIIIDTVTSDGGETRMSISADEVDDAP